MRTRIAVLGLLATLASSPAIGDETARLTVDPQSRRALADMTPSARASLLNTALARPLETRGAPSPLALAASWNPALVTRVYAAVAAQANAEGAGIVLGPSLTVGRDPRRGRIEQTFGEDSLLVSELGLAAIEGLQGTIAKGRLAPGKVLAAPTGFAGPDLPRDGAGQDPISERELRSVYIPPFAAAIGRGHVAAVVVSRNMVDGTPSHANRWLLRQVLEIGRAHV